MPTVRFLQDCVVKNCHEGTLNETRFKVGGTYTLPEDSAQHWVQRGKAERVVVEALAPPRPKVALKRGRKPQATAPVSAAEAPPGRSSEIARELDQAGVLADYVTTQKGIL